MLLRFSAEKYFGPYTVQPNKVEMATINQIRYRDIQIKVNCKI